MTLTKFLQAPLDQSLALLAQAVTRREIHACYRVKGKPKGALRVVRSSRARCRRGERKVAWSVVATSGAIGSTGQQGQQGASGEAGSSEEVLKAQISALSQRVETLEGILLGITNEDLSGVLATLQGLDNEALLGAVNAVPTLTSACATLVEQSNDLAGGVEGLIGVLTGRVTADGPPPPQSAGRFALRLRG